MTLLAPKTVARLINRSTSRLAQLDKDGVLPALRRRLLITNDTAGGLAVPVSFDYMVEAGHV
jgi:hypothetical protein